MFTGMPMPGFDFAYCSDKEKVFQNYCKYMFTRTQSMFVYEGLPDSIPVQWLEKYLQQNGSCVITQYKGTLYALIGNAGGEPDEYYQPTTYVVANPALKMSETLEIGKDCILCKNDYEGLGLIPLICRYAGLMTENLLTARLADINMRMLNLLSAPDSNTLASAKQYLKDLEAGKLGVVGEAPFFDGLKLQSNHVGSGDYMIQFIEFQQYLKGSLYNELGINANFNMKREALSGQELAMNDDALMPLIDDMLKQRREMCDRLKDMYGIEVSVDYGSTWHSNVVEKQLVAEEELGGEPTDGEEMAGDEAALPDDKDANSTDEDVSRLNDVRAEVDEEHKEEQQAEQEQENEEQKTEDEEQKTDESNSETDDSEHKDEDNGEEKKNDREEDEDDDDK